MTCEEDVIIDLLLSIRNFYSVVDYNNFILNYSLLLKENGVTVRIDIDLLDTLFAEAMSKENYQKILIDGAIDTIKNFKSIMKAYLDSVYNPEITHDITLLASLAYPVYALIVISLMEDLEFDGCINTYIDEGRMAETFLYGQDVLILK